MLDNEEETKPDDYMNLYEKPGFSIIGLFSLFSINSGFLFILSFFNYYSFTSMNFRDNVVSWIVFLVSMSIFIGVMLLRDKFLKNMFSRLKKINNFKEIYILQENMKYVALIFIFLIIMSFIRTYSFYYLNLYIGFLFLLMPIMVMFYQLLSPEGEIRIEIEQIYLTSEDFKKRQKWLSKIFKRVENELRSAYIIISHNDICYLINKNNVNLKCKKEYFENIKCWLLNNDKNTEIIQNIKNICDEIEAKPAKRINYVSAIINSLIKSEKYLAILISMILTVLRGEDIIAWLVLVLNITN